jgi:hypothetical protein
MKMPSQSSQHPKLHYKRLKHMDARILNMVYVDDLKTYEAFYFYCL